MLLYDAVLVLWAIFSKENGMVKLSMFLAVSRNFVGGMHNCRMLTLRHLNGATCALYTNFFRHC